MERKYEPVRTSEHQYALDEAYHWIIDHVHTLASRNLLDLLLPPFLAIVDDVVRSSLFDTHVALGRRRCGRDNLAPERFRDLTRGETNSASAGMNEDPVTGFCFGPTDETFVRGRVGAVKRQ